MLWKQELKSNIQKFRPWTGLWSWYQRLYMLLCWKLKGHPRFSSYIYITLHYTQFPISCGVTMAASFCAFTTGLQSVHAHFIRKEKARRRIFLACCTFNNPSSFGRNYLWMAFGPHLSTHTHNTVRVSHWVKQREFLVWLLMETQTKRHGMMAMWRKHLWQRIERAQRRRLTRNDVHSPTVGKRQHCGSRNEIHKERSNKKERKEDWKHEFLTHFPLLQGGLSTAYFIHCKRLVNRFSSCRTPHLLWKKTLSLSTHILYDDFMMI